MVRGGGAGLESWEDVMFFSQALDSWELGGYIGPSWRRWVGQGFHVWSVIHGVLEGETTELTNSSQIRCMKPAAQFHSIETAQFAGGYRRRRNRGAPQASPEIWTDVAPSPWLTRFLGKFSGAPIRLCEEPRPADNKPLASRRDQQLAVGEQSAD